LCSAHFADIAADKEDRHPFFSPIYQSVTCYTKVRTAQFNIWVFLDRLVLPERHKPTITIIIGKLVVCTRKTTGFKFILKSRKYSASSSEG